MAGSAALQRLHVALSLYDRLSAPLRQVSRGIGNFAARTERATQGLALGFVAVRGAMEGLSRTVAPFAEHSRALAELSTLDLGQGALERIDRTARRVSGRFGQDATAIVRSAYDIQSAIAGLKPDELARFTEVGAVLAKGTLAAPSVITDFMGTMFGIFEMDAARMGKGAWAETLAGMTATSVQMFKTTGARMAQYFTGLGAEAQSAGLSMAEQFAVGGRLMATMGGGEAATKFRAFLVQAGSAQRKLGLSFTDTAGRMLPVTDILDKLRHKFGETIDVAESVRLKTAFGSDEAVAFVKLLIGNTDALRGNLAALEKTRGLAPALRMAEQATTPFERLGASVKNLWLTLGRAIEPALTPALGRLIEAMQRVQGYAERFPHAARLVGTGIVGFFALAGAVGAAGVALGLLRFALAGVAPPLRMAWRLAGLLRRALSLQTAAVVLSRLSWILWRHVLVSLFTPLRTLQALARGLRLHVLASAAAVVIKVIALSLWRKALLTWRGTLLAATAAMWLFNASLWANPLTWVVAGILALIAAVAAAIIWWDELGTALRRVGAWFDGLPAWAQALGFAFAPFIALPLKVIANWERIKGFFSGLWQLLQAGAGQAGAALGDVLPLLAARITGSWRALRTAADELWAGLAGAFAGGARAIAGAIARWPARIAAAWDAMRSSASGLWLELAAGFANFAAAVQGGWAALAQSVSSLWDALRSGAAGAWQALSGVAERALAALAGAWSALPGRVAVALGKVAGPARVFAGALAAGLGKAVDAMAGLFAGLPARVAGAWGTLQRMAAAGWRGLSAGAAGAVDALAGHFNALARRIGAALEALATGFAPALDVVAGAFAALPRRVATAWEALQGAVAGFLGWLAGAFHAVLKQVGGWFTGLPQRIAGGLAAAFDNVLDALDRLAGPGSLLGQALGVVGIEWAPQTERPAARESLAQRVVRAERAPPEVRQAVTNLANTDNRRTVAITQHIRTEKYDPAAFERGLFALGYR